MRCGEKFGNEILHSVRELLPPPLRRVRNSVVIFLYMHIAFGYSFVVHLLRRALLDFPTPYMVRISILSFNLEASNEYSWRKDWNHSRWRSGISYLLSLLISVKSTQWMQWHTSIMPILSYISRNLFIFSWKSSVLI